MGRRRCRSIGSRYRPRTTGPGTFRPKEVLLAAGIGTAAPRCELGSAGDERGIAGTGRPAGCGGCWDPRPTCASRGERARPFTDLLTRVERTTPHTVVDLGCGEGALTASLAARWPGATVTGVDSSPGDARRGGGARSTRAARLRRRGRAQLGSPTRRSTCW